MSEIINVKELMTPDAEKPASVSPNIIIICAPPKVGKSKITEDLALKFAPGKTRVISNDPLGYKARKIKPYYIDILSGRKNHARQLYAVLKHLKDNPISFDFVVIDNLTPIDDLMFYKGTSDYMKSIMGRKFNRVNEQVNGPEYDWDDKRFVTTVEGLGQNGWHHQRNAMIDLMDNYFIPISLKTNLILIAHTKDKVKTDALGSTLDQQDINLTGKLSSIFAGRVNAIAMMKRKGDEAYLSFKHSSKQTNMGSHYSHLQGEVLISKLIDKEKDEIETYWENIYPDYKKA